MYLVPDPWQSETNRLVDWRTGKTLHLFCLWPCLFAISLLRRSGLLPAHHRKCQHGWNESATDRVRETENEWHWISVHRGILQPKMVSETCRITFVAWKESIITIHIQDIQNFRLTIIPLFSDWKGSDFQIVKAHYQEEGPHRLKHSWTANRIATMTDRERAR